MANEAVNNVIAIEGFVIELFLDLYLDYVS